MANNISNQYSPDYFVTPGEVLDDYLDSFEMSQVELSARSGLTKKTINEIVNGKAPISPESALKFEKIFGRPAHFWNNLEQNYQEDKVRFEERERLEKSLDWLSLIPTVHMVKLGWIAKFKDKVMQLVEVLRFFGVASPEQWQTVWQDYQVAYRKSEVVNQCNLSISAWLRQGELEAQKINCSKFDRSEFLKALKSARARTCESPEVFLPRLTDSCANAGVAVTFVPELPKTGTSGCTRWLGSKAVIQLSLRYKSNDQLWFTFFHEAGHILKHGRKEIFLEGNGMDAEKEEDANNFARNHLIPPQEFKRFIECWDGISLGPIKDFAKDIGIAPGLVVGRLQFEKLLPFSHGNKLKAYYKWA